MASDSEPSGRAVNHAVNPSVNPTANPIANPTADLTANPIANPTANPPADTSLPASLLIPISPPRKRQRQTRTSYTHKQKKWLRDLYIQRSKVELKAPSYSSLADAFQLKFEGERLGDGTITRCVTLQGEFLNGPMVQLSQHRNRHAQWPEMEDSLHKWQLRMEQSTSINGHILKKKVTEFFEKLQPLIKHY